MIQFANWCCVNRRPIPFDCRIPLPDLMVRFYALDDKSYYISAFVLTFIGIPFAIWLVLSGSLFWKVLGWAIPCQLDFCQSPMISYIYICFQSLWWGRVPWKNVKGMNYASFHPILILHMTKSTNWCRYKHQYNRQTRCFFSFLNQFS